MHHISGDLDLKYESIWKVLNVMQNIRRKIYKERKMIKKKVRLYFSNKERIHTTKIIHLVYDIKSSL